MTTPISELTETFSDAFKKIAGAAALSLTLQGEPSSNNRPRVGRWGTYYPTKYTAWRKKAEDRLVQFNGPHIEKGTAIAVHIESIFARPKTSKLRFPRPDVDNVSKGPLDALTKAKKFWSDDTQVVALLSTKRFAEDGEEPRTIINWFPIP